MPRTLLLRIESTHPRHHAPQLFFNTPILYPVQPIEAPLTPIREKSMDPRSSGPSLHTEGSDLQAVDQLAKGYRLMADQLAKVIVRQHDVVEQVLTAMFCQGHVLLVGVPGLPKTLLAKTITDVLHLS